MTLSREQFQKLRSQGLSVDQIVRFESGEKPSATQDAGPQRMALSMGPAGLMRVPEEAAGPVGRFLTGAMPALGGMAGGASSALAGPAAPFIAPATAALGSLIGSAGQSLVTGQPFSAPQAGNQAGWQAGAEATGGLASAMSKNVAQGLMRMALRPAKGVVKSAPGIVRDVLEQGGTVMPVGPKMLPKIVRGGQPQAAAVMGARGAATKAAVDLADKTGPALPGGLKATYAVRMNRLLPSPQDIVPNNAMHVIDERAAAKAAIAAVGRNHPAPKSINDLMQMKRDLWDNALAIVEKSFPGSKKSVDQLINSSPMEARVAYHTAKNIQKFVDKITTAGPSIGALDAATAKAIGVNKAIADAEAASRAGVSPWIPMTVGRAGAAGTGAALGATANPEHRVQGGIEGALVGAAMTHPAVASRLAHALNNPLWLMLLRQSPRAALSMLNGPTAAPADTTQ